MNIPGAGPAEIVPQRRRSARVRAVKPRVPVPPTEVWSSFGGAWRLVKIRKATLLGQASGAVLVGAGVLTGLAAGLLSIQSGAARWPLVLAVTAIVLGGGGVIELIRISTTPNRAVFDGQVIACWQEEEKSANGAGHSARFAVDDGNRAWTFGGSPAHRVAIGDDARLIINPRSGELLELTVTQHRLGWISQVSRPGGIGRSGRST